MAVLNLQRTDDLKSAFIHERCIKINFVPDSGRSLGSNLKENCTCNLINEKKREGGREKEKGER